MLEVHGPAEADSASCRASLRLPKKSSSALADLVEHPLATAGTQSGAFRDLQLAAQLIEQSDAEVCATDVDGEDVIHKVSLYETS
jgi:hypothetical protein